MGEAGTELDVFRLGEKEALLARILNCPDEGGLMGLDRWGEKEAEGGNSPGAAREGDKDREGEYGSPVRNAVAAAENLLRDCCCL